LFDLSQVKAVFGSGKKKVAGCLVDDGKLQKGAMMEVVRNKQVSQHCITTPCCIC
jgi:translation initiation factor IF-2